MAASSLVSSSRALLIWRDFLPPFRRLPLSLWRSDSSDGVGIREVRRWHVISPSPSPRERSSSPRSLTSPPCPPRLHRRGVLPAIFGAVCHRWSCPVIVLFVTTASTHLLRSSRGVTLKRRKLLTLWLGGGVFGSPTRFLLLLLSFLASSGRWRCRRASSFSSLRMGRRRGGSRPFSVFRWRKCSAGRRVRKWWT